MTRVAFIGLGRMGLPMASNLIRAGFAVTGCDLDGDRCAALAVLGGAIAATPAEAAAHSDMTLSIIMNDAILQTVACGADGVIASARPGHLYCDLSTVSPAASAQVAAAMASRGVSYLCAKVAGSIGLAQSGVLT
ncbi:MAG: NAD(P)-binding domain-containing protein, partial [Beijerinckiaceae bacterium]